MSLVLHDNITFSKKYLEMNRIVVTIVVRSTSRTRISSGQSSQMSAKTTQSNQILHNQTQPKSQLLPVRVDQRVSNSGYDFPPTLAQIHNSTSIHTATSSKTNTNSGYPQTSTLAQIHDDLE